MRLIRKLVRGNNCKDESKGVEKSKKGSDQNGAEYTNTERKREIETNENSKSVQCSRGV